MTGFFEDNTSPAANTTTVTAEATDTGFFPTQGIPTLLSEPFGGVLQNSTAHIGTVTLDNALLAATLKAGTAHIGSVSVDAPVSLAPNSSVDVGNLVQTSVSNWPQTTAVTGSVSITNDSVSVSVNNTSGSAIPVTLVNPPNLFDGVLKTGSAHIGSVILDGGSTSIANFPPFPTNQQVTVSNDALDVNVVGGTIGNVVLDGPITLASGLAHIGTVGVDSTTPLNVKVSNPVSELAVTNWPANLNVTVTNNAAIHGAVTITNPVTSLGINNWPATTKITTDTPLSVTVTNPTAGFSGALANSTAHIGNVSIDGVSHVVVDSMPAFPSTLAVTTANGSALNVNIVGGSTGGGSFSGALTAGTAHIGNVGLDSPIALVANSSIKIEKGSTPIDVNIVSGGSTGGGSSFSGVLANSTATIGTIHSIETPIAIDSTTPIAIHLIDPTTFRPYDGDSGGSIPVCGSGGQPLLVRVSDAVTIGTTDGTIGVSVGRGMPISALDGSAKIPVQVTGFTGSDGGSLNWVPVALTPSMVNDTNGNPALPITGFNGAAVQVAIDPDTGPKLRTADGIIGMSTGVYMPITGLDGTGTIPVTGANGAPLAITLTNPTTGQPYSGSGANALPVIGPDGGPVQVSGTVLVVGSDGGSVQVAGSVAVSNFPATQAVSITGTPTVALASNAVTVTGSVAISGTPAVNATITGTPAVTISGTPNVAVSGIVSTIHPSITATDRSNSIATGGSPQVLMPANSARRGFSIMNTSSGDLFFSDVGTASAAGSSFKLPAGALYEAPAHGVTTSGISIFGATTGQTFAAREW